MVGLTPHNWVTAVRRKRRRRRRGGQQRLQSWASLRSLSGFPLNTHRPPSPSLTELDSSDGPARGGPTCLVACAWAATDLTASSSHLPDDHLNGWAAAPAPAIAAEYIWKNYPTCHHEYVQLLLQERLSDDWHQLDPRPLTAWSLLCGGLRLPQTGSSYF